MANNIPTNMHSTLLHSDDGAYRAVRALTPLMLDDIEELDREMENEDADLAMSRRSLQLAFENFVTLERVTSLSNKKFHTMKTHLRETKFMLSLTKDEVRAQTQRADSREKDVIELKAKLEYMEKERAFLRESFSAAKAECEKVNQEIAQVRAKEKELLEWHVAKVSDVINKEVFEAHCRSLTLAGVTPGDPRWIHCWFPHEGSRPAEWEAMKASLVGSSSGHSVQHLRIPKIEYESDTTPEKSLKKKRIDNGNEDKKLTTSKQYSCKEQSGMKVMTGKKEPEKEKLQPTDAELRNIISGILIVINKETVTLGDFLKILAKRYKSDFTSRKSSIISMIKDECACQEKLEDTDDDDETGKAKEKVTLL